MKLIRERMIVEKEIRVGSETAKRKIKEWSTREEGRAYGQNHKQITRDVGYIKKKTFY